MPDYFRHVIAPGLLAHQKSFHVLGMHYHFTPTGGTVVLVAVAIALIGAFFAKLLRS